MFRFYAAFKTGWGFYLGLFNLVHATGPVGSVENAYFKMEIDTIWIDNELIIQKTILKKLPGY